MVPFTTLGDHGQPASDAEGRASKDAIRVLAVVDSLSLGGAERVLATLGAVADRVGLELSVVVLSGEERGATMAALLKLTGVPVSYLGIRRLADPRALPRLIAAIVRSRCDVVHAHLEYASTLVPVAARVVGVPVVCTFHHVAVPLGGREGLRERLAVRMASRTKRVVFVSAASMTSFGGIYGGRRKNWTVLPNGVEMTQFAVGAIPPPADLGIPSDALVVTLVGALRVRKGHAEALRAWPKVVAEIPRAHLLFVGDGPEEESLRRQAEELGIAGSVTFAGARPDVAPALHASDVVILPSHAEALPTSLIEAAACGKPVVATSVGGIPEVVIDGQTGYLVPFGDEEALANRIVDLLRDSTARTRLGASARERAESRFDAVAWATSLRLLYAEAGAAERPATRCTRRSGSRRAV